MKPKDSKSNSKVKMKSSNMFLSSRKLLRTRLLAVASWVTTLLHFVENILPCEKPQYSSARLTELTMKQGTVLMVCEKCNTALTCFFPPHEKPAATICSFCGQFRQIYHGVYSGKRFKWVHSKADGTLAVRDVLRGTKPKVIPAQQIELGPQV